MSAILDAAVVVFSQVGVDRATTNAIAEAAGISPGSLYQYYADKAEIARSVGARYAEQIMDAHRAALEGTDLVGAPIDAVLDRMLDPIVAFKNANPAFLLLFARADLPESIVGPVRAVDAAFATRVAEVLALRNPDAGLEVVRSAAATAIVLFRGVVGALGGEDGQVELAEVKLALRGYLDQKGLR